MIACKIEQLHTASESAWILSVPAETVTDTIVQFAALYFKKVNRIRFVDRQSNESMKVERNENNFILSCSDNEWIVTDTWLEAVAAMLTDVAINGWSDTAHIDADFESPKGPATICICIDPPVYL